MQIFWNDQPLVLAEIFLIIEIHDPNNQKTHVIFHTKFTHVHECLDTCNRRDACF